MPSFETFKRLNNGVTNGEMRRSQSNMIMEATWEEDLQSKVAYIYDYYHDDEPLKYKNLNSVNSQTKFKIDIKFIVNSYNSENKDQVGYHVQFKPSFNWEQFESLGYYQTSFVDKYDAEWPIGMYIDIPDEKGNYRKWLITENANSLLLQFPTWYILPVDHVFQWISDGVKYQMCGVSRSQSSYNSGEWTDYIFSTVENQRKCILPMNDISATMYYNQRIVLSAPIKKPTTWHCSKVEQTSPKGTNRITFAQSEWDEHKDVFEYKVFDEESQTYKFEYSSTYDSTKQVVGMWADYNVSAIAPTDNVVEFSSSNVQESSSDDLTSNANVITSTITYSGVKPELSIGGGYKKLTIKFYDADSNEIPFMNGTWNYFIDNVDVSQYLTVLTNNESSDLQENQIKIKFVGDNSYIGKVLHVSYINENVSASVDLSLKAL